MTRARPLLPLVCAVLVSTGCAGRSPAGAPSPDGAPPFASLQPMPRAPGPLPEDGLLPKDELSPEELGADPMPYEQFTFTERLHALAGNSPEFGVVDARDRAVLVIHWFGEPPAEVSALIDEYADAPFDIRVESTRFRPGDLRSEARRLLEAHPGVVTGTFPRNEGDGVGLGIDPSFAASPGQGDLKRLGITSRFPLFPESMSRPVPAVGAASG
jgi:hypothetical protein